MEELKIIEAFYNGEYYLLPKYKYCMFTINSIRVAIRHLRKILPYPVFRESLFQCLASLVQKRNPTKCFEHLRKYNCLCFTDTIVWGGHGDQGRGGWTAKILDYYNRKEFELYEPLQIVEVFGAMTKYGREYFVIRFVTSRIYYYKAYLPNSCYREIKKVTKIDPERFDFSKKQVYFRIVEWCTYKGNKYPKIQDILIGDPPMYKLYSEEAGVEILGKFYEQELSLVRK